MCSTFSDECQTFIRLTLFPQKAGSVLNTIRNVKGQMRSDANAKVEVSAYKINFLFFVRLKALVAKGSASFIIFATCIPQKNSHEKIHFIITFIKNNITLT